MSPKFAPGLRARAIWKPKSFKFEGFGRLFEVNAGKICTTPVRESDLEVKIITVKAGRVGRVEVRQIGTASVRESDAEVKTIKQLAWSDGFLKLKSAKFAPCPRARAIRKSKPLKRQGLGPLLEVQSAFRVAGAGISWFVRWLFEVSDAECVEGL